MRITNVKGKIGMHEVLQKELLSLGICFADGKHMMKCQAWHLAASQYTMRKESRWDLEGCNTPKTAGV